MREVQTIFILFLLSHLCCTWRTNRRPSIMGDLLSYKYISPHRVNVQRKIVAYHNYFRSRVVPSASNMLMISWHAGAAKTAQEWSQKCQLLNHDNMTGRFVKNFGACGQNIFVATQKLPWLFAIKTWHLERKNFTYGSAKNDLDVVGHYTQMIWATTHKIGCGLTKCPMTNGTRSYFNYVCNYCPIGNKLKRLGRPYKIGKACKYCPENCTIGSKLCTNGCPVADRWANCKQLMRTWPTWLCHTNSTQGHLRRTSCRATCTCTGKLFD